MSCAALVVTLYEVTMQLVKAANIGALSFSMYFKAATNDHDQQRGCSTGMPSYCL